MDQGSSKDDANCSDMERSGWSDLGDSAVLQLLDEPFDMEKDTSQLRSDEKYGGFDEYMGSTWIYPTNFPIRSYQFNITKAALFRNTLVVLPTGLGKTFIAAVVMYNIYRWYPTGKVIFMAPTRPLVGQQIEACRKIMGIPLSDTAEMTGRQNKKLRRELWASKRVFFATPQVVQSDINDVEQEFPFAAIKLLVVDEAHKAKGRYAYTEVVQSIAARNSYFRVLALSATPGRQIEDVVEVVRNLLISHLEIRWENSIDVSTYTHKKHIKIISVTPSKDLAAITNEFMEIIDPYVRFLVENNILAGNVNNLTRGRLIMEQKRFREMCMRERHPNQAAASTNFSICISLYHALELLERHGTRVFLNFFDDNSNSTDGSGSSEKFFVALNPTLRAFLEKLRNYVGPSPFSNCDLSMTLGRCPEIPQDFDFGHPKYEIAKNFLLEHFKKDEESRAIVFCEYRESVLLLYHLLQQNQPQIKSRIFVGQGGTGTIRAVTQKEQIEVMNDFRQGVCNTLIATSVAEEGIDVGEVDLIICFDISTKNPTRFTQRIGRTGRRKQGSVIMLTTEGKEYAVAKEVLATKDKTNQKIAKSAEVTRMLYKNSPRLVPPEYNPKCQETKMQINEEEVTPQKGRKRGQTKESGNGKRGKKASNNENPGIDVRKYFKRIESTEFSDPSRNNHSISFDEDLPNGSEHNTTFLQEEPSTSRAPHKEMLERTKRRLSKKINALSRKLTKSLPKLETTSPKSIITSNSSSQLLKKLVLEKNPEYVKEKYEAMMALKALNENESNLGEDAICLMSEYSAIEEVFGSKYEIETFLKAKRKNNKSIDFDIKCGKLFDGFQVRDLDDDVSSFIEEKLSEFKDDELEIVFNGKNLETLPKASESYQESPLTTKLGRSFLSNDKNFVNEIRAQSTPLRKTLFTTTKEYAPQRQLNKLSKNEELSENLFDDEFEDFEAAHNNSKDSREFVSNLRHNAETIGEQNKIKTRVEKESSKFGKEEDDLFDDDFDEIIACSSIITQIDKGQNPANIICSEPLKETTESLNEKERKLDNTKSSRPELEDFDLNDFLDPFEAEIAEVDEKLNEAASEQRTIDSSNYRNQSEQPLGAYNKSHSFADITETIGETSKSPCKMSPARSLAGTSPSLFSRAPNLSKLKLLSLGGTKSAKEDEEAKENYVQELNTEVYKCSQYCESQVNNESVIFAPRMKRRNRAVTSSESDEEEPNCNRTPKQNEKTARRKIKKRRCDFIDDEAMVSGEDSSDCVENTYDDGMSQFVVDTIIAEEEEDNETSATNMQIKYLESIRSPKKLPGQFKIPEPRNFMDMSKIFSQPVLEESISAYKEDSFVVSDEENVSDGELTQLCPLEQAEAILKAKRKAKRKGLEFTSATPEVNTKRKRWRHLKQLSDSSDEGS